MPEDSQNPSAIDPNALPPVSQSPQVGISPNALPQVDPNLPINETQSAQPSQTPPPPKSFPLKKVLLASLVLFLIIGLAGAGRFLYQKSANKDSAQNKSEALALASPTSAIENNLSQQVSNSLTEALSTNKKSWDECKVFEKESDYIPTNLGKEYAKDENGPSSTGSYILNAEFIPKGEMETINLKDIGFGVQVRKKAASEEGDINKLWDFYNNYFTQDKVGKELDGSTLVSVEKKNLYGNLTLIYAAKGISGQTGKETVYTQLMSIVPNHSMLITIMEEGDKDKVNDIQNKYQKWFDFACQPK